MSQDRTFVIVGAGLAGARAAATLREEGFDGRVVLIGEEALRPYERPPLSKDLLRGEAEGRPFVHDEGFYAEHDIELVLGRAVTRLDPGAHAVELGGGERLDYAKLLLATGAAPRRLTLPGAELGGVAYLRTLGDSEALRASLGEGRRVVVIGAGWIGCEVAASARTMGSEVTVIEPLAEPLQRVLGPEIGAIYRGVHERHGVRFLLGTGVAALEGDGQVERVRTEDGRVVACDLVVAGIGVTPRTELAAEAGLDVDNGVLVDALLRSSDPDVYACGDVANVAHAFYGTRIRVEHWANANDQGPAAARSMLGRGSEWDTLPFFFSDQFDTGMEYAGYVRDWDRVVFRGDPAGGEFIAFWLEGGRVAAGMNFNVWDVNEHIQALIRSRREVDPAALADAGVSLEALAAG
jgi:3-phenylpropionate/trans-cinnamate dioxygenase ferredoxin reductase subunit